LLFQSKKAKEDAVEKITRLAVLILFVFVILTLVACDGDSNESSQVTSVDRSQLPGTTTQVEGKSTGLRVILLTSDQHYIDHKADEVSPALLEVINSGEYNIVSVKTTYVSGYLTSAEVYYDAVSGDGNHVRLLLISDDDDQYIDHKENVVKPLYEEAVNSGNYDVISTRTVYVSGYFVAAEIYYREP
jgi:hypothetical protein